MLDIRIRATSHIPECVYSVTVRTLPERVRLSLGLPAPGFRDASDCNTAIENADAEDWEVSNNRSLLEHVMNTERDPDKWEQYIVETNQLDKVRKQSILSFIPEFEEYWHE